MNKPKKSLGQNFLSNPKVIDKIVSTPGLEPGDLVVEIGPGRGAITGKILQSGARLLAVEIDKNLCELLSDKFRDEVSSRKLTLINKDILDFELPSEDYKVIGNIPYFITGKVLRYLLESKNKPKSITLVMQKEVVNRIVERDEKGSILSKSVQVYGQVRKISNIPAKFFSPKPEVDSAILYIDKINSPFVTKKEEDLFFKVLKSAFRHKRKLMWSNLKEIIPIENIITLQKNTNFGDKIRAEELSTVDWFTLVKEISAVNK